MKLYAICLIDAAGIDPRPLKAIPHGLLTGEADFLETLFLLCAIVGLLHVLELDLILAPGVGKDAIFRDRIGEEFAEAIIIHVDEAHFAMLGWNSVKLMVVNDEFTACP